MTAVGITENVKGDVKKFEIWYSGREEVYVVQVRRRVVVKHCQHLYDASMGTYKGVLAGNANYSEFG